MENNSIANEINREVEGKDIISKRILAFLIDLILFGFIGGVLGGIFHKIEGLVFLSDYLPYILLFLFLMRDIYNEHGSIGKSLLKIKIISNNGLKASASKRLLRNITTLIWPLELLMLLIKSKRISDSFLQINVIANLPLINNNKDNN